MRMAGLEPARIAPLPPQDSVSTNFTTSANLSEVAYRNQFPDVSPGWPLVVVFISIGSI